MNKYSVVLSVIWFSLLLVNALGDTEIISSVDTGDAPLTVSFYISDTVDSYAWDFNNDGIIDSTEAEPKYTFTKSGKYSVDLNATIDGISTTTKKTIVVKSQLSVSIVANPASGQAPLNAQFTVASTGKAPLVYAWDFNQDKVIDSILQNPIYTFTLPGEYNVSVKVTDAEGNSAEKVYPLSITKFDSHLNLTAYFPQTLALGENQITLLINNDGTEPVKDINAKMIGIGIQHLTSSSITLLNPGEQDSLTVKVKVLQGGDLAATAKVLDKSVPITFKVVEEIKYNKEEIQVKLNSLKEQFQAQENIYTNKKAEGFLVSDIFENIKSIQKQVQDTQQLILSGKYADASINLDLITSAVTDLTADLERSQKQKQTILQWLKENALAITAIIAALGTLSGILIKVKSHATKVKDQVKEQAQRITEDVKKKFPLKKKSHAEVQEHSESKDEQKKETLEERKEKKAEKKVSAELEEEEAEEDKSSDDRERSNNNTEDSAPIEKSKKE
ncbi:MAG TPA: PKD domain-containing protein [Candidatus Nanoarchaeia archaeon]|nr:PKD domain-containing protein [Candidatus Nanoarchaeia archaeon]